MANYYPQSENPGKTLTLGEFYEKIKLTLSMFDKDLPVVFKSPSFGAYGSDTYYNIYLVTVQEKPAYEYNCGKQEHYDEDTDTITYDEEGYIQQFHAWKGVVIE